MCRIIKNADVQVEEKDKARKANSIKKENPKKTVEKEYMQTGYHIDKRISLVIILFIAAVIMVLLLIKTPTNKISTTNVPSTNITVSSIPPTTINESLQKYSQTFCLNAANNASAMRFAINNGVTCFRADIGLNQGEMNFISNVTKAGAEYIGILDYVTVGMQTSRYGCASNCNWTLATWNASVAKAVSDYPEIHIWEIYNEPLITEFAGGYENENASHYFNMIKSAYTIIKSKEPNATIVCFGGAQIFPGSTVQKEYVFYQQVWQDGASQYCNAISLHAYSQPYYSFNQTVSSGATLSQVWNYTLDLYENLTGKPIWITETGLPSNNWTYGANLSEQKQALFLKQDFNLFTSHPFVKRIYWFHLVGNNGKGEDYGLLNMTTLQPKSAWYNFLNFVHNSTNSS